ncbi:MAG TPA: glutamate formimidoyltransferase [Candidatus Acetothermia bacterium]|nr:glutamate formimidoyltransferase [Candidatus Bipolaricaulota bacterium]HDI11866.1 glutamate formimidoyltransferase [Candidatus Acetothermia bacterium]
MWDKLIECVPNISEGRDRETIQAAVEAIREVKEARILDVESDPDHNRSVLTFVGTPEGVKEAVFKLFEAVLPRIDLRRHRGEHPRMGAVDVVPLVPVRGVTMEDCVSLSREIGKGIWERFRVPVYLYANSATRPEREELAAIRKGEFEGFAEKIKDPTWAPDFGEPEIHPTAGVVAVGAREFLIAFNVNLGTSDLRVAKAIAKAVRGSSGGLRYVKALGFALEERGIVQVSMNLTNYKKTPIPRVLELVRREAARYGVPVIGTEIVGLVPQEALDQVVEYYLQLENFTPRMVLERRLAEELSR